MVNALKSVLGLDDDGDGGSIMLKICVCHFLTKLHPFFTYEGGKKIGPT